MLQLIEFIAVIASAIYGILLACRKEMDVVGVIAVAFAVAFGGGTLRDLCLDRTPLFWIANDHYVMMVMGIAIVGSFIPHLVDHTRRYLDIPDAIGMGLFSITGAGYAIEAGTPIFIAAILAVVTGTFGGVIGDIICNEIPSLFRPAPIYATCSFVGAWVFLLLELTPLDHTFNILAGVGTIVLLRLVGLRWNISFKATQTSGS
ncbi:MAG: trimeric intracellular cation channel family protein [Verrucomicrobiales bacterium]